MMILLAWALVAGAAGQSSTPPARDACEATEVAVRWAFAQAGRYAADSVLLTEPDDDMLFARLETARDLDAAGHPGPGARQPMRSVRERAALYQTFLDMPQRSASECRKVRVLAAERGVRVSARSSILRGRLSNLHRPWSVLQVNLAVVSASGDDAVSYLSTSGEEGGGGDNVLFLHRFEGRAWRVVEFGPGGVAN